MELAELGAPNVSSGDPVAGWCSSRATSTPAVVGLRGPPGRHLSLAGSWSSGGSAPVSHRMSKSCEARQIMPHLGKSHRLPL